MKAILLAGGYGKRLGAITDRIPKPLAEVKGKPVIEYLINKLIKLRIEHVYINTHYKHKQIYDFIGGSNFKIPISLSHENKLLGTAGTLKNLVDKVAQDNFLVMHADNYFSDNLELLKQKHLESEPNILATMGTFDVMDPSRFGTVDVSEDNRVINFFEKSKESTSRIANSAIYIMKPKAQDVIKSLSPNENDISLHLVPKLLGQICAVPLSGYFFDIGTPEDLNLANNS